MFLPKLTTAFCLFLVLVGASIASAGDISAVVDNGVLYILGSDEADEIVVQHDQSGFAVGSLPQPENTVNGEIQIWSTEVVDRIVIDPGDGADALRLILKTDLPGGLQVHSSDSDDDEVIEIPFFLRLQTLAPFDIGDVRIDTGSGNDNIWFAHQDAVFVGSAEVNTGDGNDWVAVGGDRVEGSLLIDVGDGSDTAVIGRELQGDVTMRGGEGNKHLDVSVSRSVEPIVVDVERNALDIDSSTVIQFSESPEDDLTIIGGDSGETLWFSEVMCLPHITFQGGGGGDSVLLQSSHVENLTVNSDRRITVEGLREDEVEFDYAPSTLGRLTVQSGSLWNQVYVKELTAAEVIIETQDDGNRIEFENSVLGLVDILAGNGQDNITFSNCQLLDELTVNMGAGQGDSLTMVDVTSLGPVFIDGEAGAASVELTSLSAPELVIDTGDADDTIDLLDSDVESIEIATRDGFDLVSLVNVISESTTIELGDDNDTLQLDSNDLDETDFDGGQGEGDELMTDGENTFGSLDDVRFEYRDVGEEQKSAPAYTTKSTSGMSWLSFQAMVSKSKKSKP